VRQVHYQQLGAMRAWNARIAEQLPTAHAAVSDAFAQLNQLETKVKELTIRAPGTGVIVAPPARVKIDHDPSRLPAWSGSPLEVRNLGCWIEPGTVLCSVADPQQLEVLVAIDQADVAQLQPGQTVRILLESSPIRVVEGEVAQVARRSAERSVVNPAVESGKYHLVQVRLTSAAASLLVGSRGTAKIEARRSTLSAMVAEQLQEMLQLPW
jgi:putative peptide zinc metalloprotease protein